MHDHIDRSNFLNGLYKPTGSPLGQKVRRQNDMPVSGSPDRLENLLKAAFRPSGKGHDGALRRQCLRDGPADAPARTGNECLPSLNS